MTYAGTIGTSYDIRTLVLTGEELIRRRRLNIKIKILGGGPLKEELEQLAKSITAKKCRVCRLYAIRKDGGISCKVRHCCQFVCKESTAEYRHKNR